MTRGSFEAWMKRLVCLWGVWCRLKEFPAAWKFPFRAERENAPSGSWYERRAHRNGNTVAQDCGRGRLGQPSDFGDGNGDGVWGCVSQRSAALSLPLIPPIPLNGFRVRRVVWPRRPPGRSKRAGVPWPAMSGAHAACGLYSVVVCACLSGSVSES